MRAKIPFIFQIELIRLNIPKIFMFSRVLTRRILHLEQKPNFCKMRTQLTPILFPFFPSFYFLHSVLSFFHDYNSEDTYILIHVDNTRIFIHEGFLSVVFFSLSNRFFLSPIILKQTKVMIIITVIIINIKFEHIC